MRNGCHVELVSATSDYWVPHRISGANPTWIRERLHTCLKSRIPVIDWSQGKAVVARRSKSTYSR